MEYPKRIKEKLKKLLKIDKFQDIINSGDPEKIQDFLEEFIVDNPNNPEYLELYIAKLLADQGIILGKYVTHRPITYLDEEGYDTFVTGYKVYTGDLYQDDAEYFGLNISIDEEGNPKNVYLSYTELDTGEDFDQGDPISYNDLLELINNGKSVIFFNNKVLI